MCSSADSNRWAPRLVIILQLATWSVVGIVLLQRGATSLSTKPEDLEPDAEIQVPGATSSIDEEVRDRPDCEERKAEWHDSKGNKDPKLIQKDDQGLGAVSPRRESCNGDTSETASPSKYSGRNLRKTMRAARAKERIAQEQLLENHENKRKVDDSMVKDYLLDVTSSELDFNTGDSEESTMMRHNDSLSNESIPKDGEVGIASTSRGNVPHLKPVDRAGAAAAVAMLAIGVVMLLLAPAIVILRAIEARRRERRLPKLRAHKDLPPTYEEATFMDEAPRYSSLHLNTINDSSPETALTISSSTS